MPIFRYKCRECQAEFELLLARFDSPAECPRCASVELDKQPSRIGAISSQPAAGCAMSRQCPSASSGCCGGHCGCKH